MRAESNRSRWNNEKRPLRHSGSFKVTDFDTNRKLIYDFQVINTNLPPILHRFRDIAFDRSKIAIFCYPLCLSPPTEGFPWDDLRKIFHGCQWMANVPNAVEILPKITTAWVGCTSVTDRQMTDGRATSYSEREREFTFANEKWKNCNNRSAFGKYTVASFCGHCV